MGASVVTGGDAAPVLQLGEHVLDFVTLAVERLVIGNGKLAAFSRRDTGLDALSVNALRNQLLS